MAKKTEDFDRPLHEIETKCTTCHRRLEQNGEILVSEYRRCHTCHLRTCSDCAYVISNIEWLCAKPRCHVLFESQQEQESGNNNPSMKPKKEKDISENSESEPLDLSLGKSQDRQTSCDTINQPALQQAKGTDFNDAPTSVGILEHNYCGNDKGSRVNAHLHQSSLYSHSGMQSKLPMSTEPPKCANTFYTDPDSREYLHQRVTNSRAEFHAEQQYQPEVTRTRRISNVSLDSFGQSSECMSSGLLSCASSHVKREKTKQRDECSSALKSSCRRRTQSLELGSLEMTHNRCHGSSSSQRERIMTDNHGNYRYRSSSLHGNDFERDYPNNPRRELELKSNTEERDPGRYFSYERSGEESFGIKTEADMSHRRSSNAKQPIPQRKDLKPPDVHDSSERPKEGIIPRGRNEKHSSREKTHCISHSEQRSSRKEHIPEGIPLRDRQIGTTNDLGKNSFQSKSSERNRNERGPTECRGKNSFDYSTYHEQSQSVKWGNKNQEREQSSVNYNENTLGVQKKSNQQEKKRDLHHRSMSCDQNNTDEKCDRHYYRRSQSVEAGNRRSPTDFLNDPYKNKPPDIRQINEKSKLGEQEEVRNSRNQLQNYHEREVGSRNKHGRSHSVQLEEVGNSRDRLENFYIEREVGSRDRHRRSHSVQLEEVGNSRDRLENFYIEREVGSRDRHRRSHSVQLEEVRNSRDRLENFYIEREVGSRDRHRRSHSVQLEEVGNSRDQLENFYIEREVGSRDRHRRSHSVQLEEVRNSRDRLENFNIEREVGSRNKHGRSHSVQLEEVRNSRDRLENFYIEREVGSRNKHGRSHSVQLEEVRNSRDRLENYHEREDGSRNKYGRSHSEQLEEVRNSRDQLENFYIEREVGSRNKHGHSHSVQLEEVGNSRDRLENYYIEREVGSRNKHRRSHSVQLESPIFPRGEVNECTSDLCISSLRKNWNAPEIGPQIIPRGTLDDYDHMCHLGYIHHDEYIPEINYSIESDKRGIFNEGPTEQHWSSDIVYNHSDKYRDRSPSDPQIWSSLIKRPKGNFPRFYDYYYETPKLDVQSRRRYISGTYNSDKLCSSPNRESQREAFEHYYQPNRRSSFDTHMEIESVYKPKLNSRHDFQHTFPKEVDQPRQDVYTAEEYKRYTLSRSLKRKEAHGMQRGRQHSIDNSDVYNNYFNSSFREFEHNRQSHPEIERHEGESRLNYRYSQREKTGKHVIFCNSPSSENLTPIQKYNVLPLTSSDPSHITPKSDDSDEVIHFREPLEDAESDYENEIFDAKSYLPKGSPSSFGYLAVRIQRCHQSVRFTLVGAYGLRRRNQPIAKSIYFRAYAIGCTPPYESNDAHDSPILGSAEPYWGIKWKLPLPNDELKGNIFDIYIWNVEFINGLKELQGVASVTIKASNYCDKIQWIPLLESFRDNIDRKSPKPTIAYINGIFVALHLHDIQMRLEDNLKKKIAKDTTRQPGVLFAGYGLMGILSNEIQLYCIMERFIDDISGTLDF